ncbi:MAG: sulfatase-like hydrolase/transferase, partial [Fimbriimonadaceae bacterium]|nr:sulfatase-like hydrolase/transferase [Fimbriimonadaceae bacterium]
MLTGIALCLATSVPLASSNPPNVILIVSDDHARAAISAYGSPHIQTPHIDQLAREGVRFDRHYTPNPLCAPSRA